MEGNPFSTGFMITRRRIHPVAVKTGAPVCLCCLASLLSNLRFLTWLISNLVDRQVRQGLIRQEPG